LTVKSTRHVIGGEEPVVNANQKEEDRAIQHRHNRNIYALAGVTIAIDALALIVSIWNKVTTPHASPTTHEVARPVNQEAEQAK
jgi:hypothetical protein